MAQPSRPDLLFLSPVMPARAGNGLAMRAGLLVEALAPLFRVHLHVVELFPSPLAPEDPAWLEQACADVAVQSVAGDEDGVYRMIRRIADPAHRLAALAGYPKPQLCRFATAAAVAETRARHAATRFAAVHVFRLYMAPFARAWLDAPAAARPRCWLDLDDWDSRTARRLADLYAANGEPARAWLERAEAAKLERLEDEMLARFDAVCLAGAADREALAGRCGAARLVHLPNAVRLPREAPPKAAGGPFTLLLVGSMSYYPNEDAACFLCREVLPRLRARIALPLRLVIAGTLPSPAVAALHALPEVTVTGAVADLAPLYRAADVVIAPLRAGGGTRIKILEAFAHRRPVVATTIGAEGIAARDREHLLLADTADGLAAACAELHETPALAASLAERALGLVRQVYASERVRAQVQAFARAQAGRPPVS